MSYRDLLLSVKQNKRLVLLLKIVDVGTVLLTVCSYIALLAVTAFSDLFFAVKLMAVCGIPFVVVSAIRRLINAPRPYELLDDVYDVPPKKTVGRSFPSRHVFSVFSIGTAICFIYPFVGAAVIVLGLLMSISRVLLGKHFLRDVTAGALIGSITSIIGMIIMI